jgi:heat shock protein HtpX
MATLYTEQNKNVRKTWFLMTIFLVIVIAIGYFISWYYDNSIILIAVAFSLVMNFISYWHSDKISLSLTRAVPADRDSNLELFRIVENLSITAGLPMPKVYIIEDQSPNAFATGRNKEHATIAVTRGLLNMMDKNELSGVIAHELSHIGNRDILLQTVVVVLVGMIAILADFFLRTSWLGGGKRGSSRQGGGQLGSILVIVGIVFVILSPVIAQLIQLAVSRRREFLADTNGALLTRYPEGLASALEKISAVGLPMSRANNATAHLFIANPFGAGASRGLAKLFMTHPPTEERVKILREMAV